MNKYERQGIREKKRPQNKRVKSRPAAAATIAKAKSVVPPAAPAKAKSARHPRRYQSESARRPQRYQSESVMPAPCGRRTKKRGESPNGFF